MSDPQHTPGNSQPNAGAPWLDDGKNVDKIYWGLIAACALLMLVEPFYHKHPYLGFDGSFGFYGWFGLLAAGSITLIARQMQRILGRREDFFSTNVSPEEDDR